MRMLFVLVILFLFVEVRADNWRTERRNNPFKPEHEFYFGAGVGGMTAYEEEDNKYWKFDSPIHFEGDLYRGAKYTAGTYFMGYNYHMKRWLSFGASVFYTSFHAHLYEYYSDRKIGKEAASYFGIRVLARYTWLTRKWFRMYSELGIGILQSRELHDSKIIDKVNHRSFVSPQATILGISAGRRWFVFMEGGFSEHGAFNGGVGYRLNVKNKI